ncbi:phosphatidylinositol-3-phosphatase [Starmerella bacillaris]|uniref:Phosphatidylinositol-3-phosphatase n=1 Tax=Starmerella bacillaris TaxID=1247836 RepID=A0AAV5RHH6_STABA|nr:phosphatidylinositol-3-phosphatase [Starmerella bacillaris]
MRFWNTTNEFVFRTPTETLAIERISGRISSPADEKLMQSLMGSGSSIVGILGIVDLPRSKLLVLATKCEHSGNLLDNEVYKITSTDVLPLSDLNKNDAHYMSLVKAHFKKANLYFSPTTDLTNSQQRLAQQKPCDSRFLWNHEISRDFQAFPQFFTPVVFGIFSEKSADINNHTVQLSLLSRRSRFRAGTRYFRRGLDVDGHAANYNETEQIVWVDRSDVYSYVQTRGSVPAFWGEVNTLKYRPKLQIGDISASVVAAEKHFAEQKKLYGPQILVNLVNQSGYEKRVKDTYEAVVSELKDKDIEYVYFDFHKECSKMRWHRVKLLMNQLEELGLYEHGWFHKRGETVLEEQAGVIRTNCMDCLDRTNVVQSTIALNMAERQLQDAGVFPQKLDITFYQDFTKLFRNMWADNADGVSCAYSGTGALKTDFTRTGKRTKWGAFDDFCNSLLRYYRNNLTDGPRQDGFSVALGDYTMPSRVHPFVDRRPLVIQSMPYIMFGCGLVTFMSVLFPSQNHGFLFNMVMTCIFALMFLYALWYIFANGIQYVNWPKLTPVEFVTGRNGCYSIKNDYVVSKDD